MMRKISSSYHIIEHIPIGLGLLGKSVSLYVILNIQRSFPRCLSPQQVILESMVVWDKGGKVNEVPFAVGARAGCAAYLKPFRK